MENDGRHLILNVHLGLPFPEPENNISRHTLVHGDYLYYHYGCDGVDDRGWGCGYRTLQTMSSWVCAQTSSGQSPPGLRQIQEALVTMSDKDRSFIGSRSWIGSFEIALCIDYFYQLPCKILHLRSGADLKAKLEELYEHFDRLGSLAMMGGDSDSASKGILGLCSGKHGHYMLVLDPHFYGPPGSISTNTAQKEGWISWRKIELFERESFYNICLPQLAAQ
ncbi:inactive Ufm1-specific protease 1 [Polypterus senegalus]